MGKNVRPFDDFTSFKEDFLQVTWTNVSLNIVILSFSMWSDFGAKQGLAGMRSVWHKLESGEQRDEFFSISNIG